MLQSHNNLNVMRKISQKQLTEHVNLVKWQQKKELQKFNLLTVHSLLLNSNPVFIQLKQKIQNFNSSIDKGVDRKHSQYESIKKLYELLRQMVQISNFQLQQEFLQNVHQWSKQGVRSDCQLDYNSQHSKSRPTTAATRTRLFSAYSRPKSGAQRMNLVKVQERLQIKNSSKKNHKIDYDKLRPGDIQFYTGARTIQHNQQQPKKRLKQYQRKIFYQEEPDSDLEFIEIKRDQERFGFKTVNDNRFDQAQQQKAKGEEVPANEQGDNQNPQDGEDNIGGQDQMGGEDQVNIDDLPIEGQLLNQHPQEVVDKLKPKCKVYTNRQNQLQNGKINYKGMYEYLEGRNQIGRRKNQDEVIQSDMLKWAKQKSRINKEQRRRAQSARIVTKKIGVGYKKNENAGQNINSINFQDIPIPATKQFRPKTAFHAFNESNRNQLIKNCFISGNMHINIQKGQGLGTAEEHRTIKITSLAQRPKKKTFQEILRDAEQRVKEEQAQQIMNVKQKFAKNKVPFETNRIAKSVTYHAQGAQEGQYQEQENFGPIIGMNMIKNPFFKVGKKKKKKKKKK